MPRYMVELVYRYYTCRGYLVRIGIPIRYRRRMGRVEKEFIKFLDIAAYRGNELHLVECRTLKNVKKVRPALERIARFYSYVDENLAKYFEDGALPRAEKIVKLLVVEDEDIPRIERYRRILDKHSIAIASLSSLLDDIVRCAEQELALRASRGEGDTLLAVIARIKKFLDSKYGRSEG